MAARLGFAIRAPPFFAPNELYVADIYENPKGLPQDENKILPVNSVSQKNKAAAKTEIPEDFGNHALLGAFAVQPLKNKPHHEQELAKKTQCYPKIELGLKPCQKLLNQALHVQGI